MKQGQNFTKSKFKYIALNQQGQAVVEYILLLVVIISMLMATKGLFTGANKFIDDYVGKYFICLMDYGELPKLGSSDTDLNQHTGGGNPCAAKFTVAGGAQLGGGGSGGSTGGGSTNTKNSTNKIAGGNDSAGGSGKGGSGSGKSTSSKSRSSGSDSESSGGGSSSNSNYANGRIERSRSNGTSDGPNDNGSNKIKIIDEDQVGAQSRYGDNSTNSNKTEYRYNRYKAITSGQMFDEIEKKSSREVRKSEPRVVSKAAEEGFRPGPRKNAFVPPERKPAAIDDDKETNFGFGAMMKWLMIAGMVVAIIVFFGGQIMNYSNSD